MADDDEDDDDLMPRAFRVDGEPDFDSGPPATAEEYLRRVR
jgi:survival of motor neuron protein-interacting protein 1